MLTGRVRLEWLYHDHTRFSHLIQGRTPHGYAQLHADNWRYVLPCALYPERTLNADTTVYTTSGEVVASGYTAGGAVLTSIAPTSSGDIAFTSFNDVTFTASITANGALIYNSTKSNKAVAVLAFGADKTSTPTFVVTFPTFSSTTAIIRIV